MPPARRRPERAAPRAARRGSLGRDGAPATCGPPRRRDRRRLPRRGASGRPPARRALAGGACRSPRAGARTRSREDGLRLEIPDAIAMSRGLLEVEAVGRRAHGLVEARDLGDERLLVLEDLLRLLLVERYRRVVRRDRR